jgi:HSP20 family protein
MNLTKWEPFGGLTRFEPTLRGFGDITDRLNRMLTTSFFEKPLGEEMLTAIDWVPSIDIQETDKEYLIKAEVPEVKKEDVKVTVENGVLYLKGERRQEKEEKGRRFHRTERTYGSFMRSFTLPADADEKKIAAEFKDGMLNVHLSKSETAKPKAIEIKVN